MRADFAGFASVSGVSENERELVLVNFTQANIGSVGNAKSFVRTKFGRADSI